MPRRQTRINRHKPNCFVVVTYEGCWCPKVCQAPHYVIDCELHGTLARVGTEETARFVLAGHKESPIWPKPMAPLTDGAVERIAAARTGQRGRIFVPSRWKGGE